MICPLPTDFRETSVGEGDVGVAAPKTECFVGGVVDKSAVRHGEASVRHLQDGVFGSARDYERHTSSFAV